MFSKSRTYTVSGNNVVQVGGQLCIVAAQNAGTITGNRVTFVVLPSQGTQIMHAFGPGSSISMTNTVLDITNSSTQSFDNNRGAFANLGGTVTLTDCAITESGTMAFEPYGKVSVVNEFLGGYTATTDQNSFFPTTSGVAIQAAAGLAARLSNAIYLYGEYDYYNSERLRTPWSFTAGLRCQW